MRGLGPRTHEGVLRPQVEKFVDGRAKPGHDEEKMREK
jgi:hypothetical protein